MSTTMRVDSFDHASIEDEDDFLVIDTVEKPAVSVIAGADTNKTQQQQLRQPKSVSLIVQQPVPLIARSPSPGSGQWTHVNAATPTLVSGSGCESSPSSMTPPLTKSWSSHAAYTDQAWSINDQHATVTNNTDTNNSNTTTVTNPDSDIVINSAETSKLELSASQSSLSSSWSRSITASQFELEGTNQQLPAPAPGQLTQAESVSAAEAKRREFVSKRRVTESQLQLAANRKHPDEIATFQRQIEQLTALIGDDYEPHSGDGNSDCYTEAKSHPAAATAPSESKVSEAAASAKSPQFYLSSPPAAAAQPATSPVWQLFPFALFSSPPFCSSLLLPPIPAPVKAVNSSDSHSNHANDNTRPSASFVSYFTPTFLRRVGCVVSVLLLVAVGKMGYDYLRASSGGAVVMRA